MRVRRLALAATAAAALSAGLMAVAAPPADSAGTTSLVSLTLREWELTPATVTARAGRVSFVVRNAGTMTHELVVLRSDRHHHNLPVKGGKAVETGRVARIPAIPVGASKRLTLRMAPGRYVLLCNILGHYQAGQYAALRVR
ncbi:MAG TPA: hypothetical protein VNK94_07035 [Gaiellaceae bacterium]|nr:hypothetical protein [Gaiellaceae bacterium]